MPQRMRRHMKGQLKKMSSKTRKRAFLPAACVASALLAHNVKAEAVEPSLNLAATDIGGTVTGQNGPEAGVWIIAETTDLPTRFRKIVLTDDKGQFLLPDMPKATYSVWVRGYGLADSPREQAAPGATVHLRASPAASAAAAAEIYPPIYWFSMLHVPKREEFPLENMKSQEAWLNTIKSGACQSCHALGTPGVRTIRKELGEFKMASDAWARRLQSGSAYNLIARE